MKFELKDWKELGFIFRNSGKNPEGAMLKFEDVLATTNVSQFLPLVVSEIVREAIEPLLVATSLLNRINLPFGQQFTMPAEGALHAAFIPEGGEYPERSPQRGGATITAQIGKYGLAVNVTEETIRYSRYDVVTMVLREAGRALARLKEVNVFNMISAFGTTVFDNVNPTNSIKGVTTGMGLNGQGNGSVVMDNIFDCMSQIMHQGFIPNTILMHPMAWMSWVKDPTLRQFAINSGGGTFFAGWSGAVAKTSWTEALRQAGAIIGGAGQNIIPGGNAASLTPSALTEYHPQMNSAPILPSYFPFPFRIIVSPWMPYEVNRQLTDIYMFDANELGAIAIDEEPTTEEFNDPRVDIRKIKIRERYGIVGFHGGQQIGVMKNIKVIPNEIILPPQTTIDVSATLSPVGPTDNVLS